MADDDNIIPMDVWNNRWKRDDLLTTRPRIRRSEGLPEHLASELERTKRYPYELKGVLPSDYRVIYRRSGWRMLDTPIIDEPDFTSLPVRLRKTLCWVLQGERYVAAVELREMDAEVVPDVYLWEALDDHSDELSKWAEMLLSLWSPCEFELFGYGPVLELRDVWVEPRHSRQAIWKPVAHALIDRVFRKSSALMIQAFPTEYNGLAPPGSRSAVAFERRRAAMMRVCEREFGLRPLPVYGDKGFMWRPADRVANHIREPEYDPNWR